ncbi:hypothetical protein N0V84_012459 [Fusarium piperis]|uniref:Uncharacterized protein n=1 Tax=Fusarium piperis TaxID=1435070 RepID=A0A9W8W2Q0_9HYPO|nr:hypothetical protein N0V84_012459 [Fusarium piperis]
MVSGSQNERDVANLDLATDNEEENIFPLAWKDWLTELNHSVADRFYDHFISIGPVFVDRDSTNRLHQFYTGEFKLAKTGGLGEWLAGKEPIEEVKSLPAMFSSGLIDLDDGKAINKRIKLDEVSKVILTFTIRSIPIPKDRA